MIHLVKGAPVLQDLATTVRVKIAVSRFWRTWYRIERTPRRVPIAYRLRQRTRLPFHLSNRRLDRQIARNMRNCDMV